MKHSFFINIIQVILANEFHISRVINYCIIYMLLFYVHICTENTCFNFRFLNNYFINFNWFLRLSFLNYWSVFNWVFIDFNFQKFTCSEFFFQIFVSKITFYKKIFRWKTPWNFRLFFFLVNFIEIQLLHWYSWWNF